MPYTNLRMVATDHRLRATAAMAETFYQLFVNRRAYTLQSHRPHPERSGSPSTPITKMPWKIC